MHPAFPAKIPDYGSFAKKLFENKGICILLP